MNCALLLALLPAAVSAQRLHINAPTTNQTLTAGQNFTAELHMDTSISSMAQKSVGIALTACYDVCAQPDQWGAGSVLYNGPFNPQYNFSAPTKGLYQDFSLQVPEYWPSGPSVLQVAHFFSVGAVLMPVFDYTTVLVNITDPELS